MNIGLFLINAILLTRLFLLFRDTPISKGRIFAICGVQVASLLMLEPTASLLALGFTLLVLNCIWFQAEKKFPENFNAIRAGVLLLTLVLLAFFCSPAMDLAFRLSISRTVRDAAPYFAVADYLHALNWRVFQTYALGTLLCMNEANMLVRIVIERLELKPESKQVKNDTWQPIGNEYKRGRVIGMLERLTLFFLILEGQYSALGFVIAAKTMARFKNLEDRDFAEYFLVGTFLSLVTAGAIALLTKLLLA